MENWFETRSPLIDGNLESQLSQLLETLQIPVFMTCIVDSREKSMEMGTFLNHLSGLSPMITCRFLSPDEDPALAQYMEADMLPVTGIGESGQIPRMIFHGIPGGKELSSFVMALLNAGQAVNPLDGTTRVAVNNINRPMTLEVCVSLACHHCAHLVTAAQRIAWENPMVTAHMIDANLYPGIVQKFQIQRVPLLIVDHEATYSGSKTLAELTALLTEMK